MTFTNFIRLTSPFVRFLLVGMINTIIGISLIFFLLHVLGFSYWVATITGNTVGALVSYTLNKGITFRSNIPYFKGLPRFMIVVLACYLFAYSFSKLIADFAIDEEGVLLNNAAVLLGAVFYTLLNYWGQKRIVFLERV